MLFTGKRKVNFIFLEKSKEKTRHNLKNKYTTPCKLLETNSLKENSRAYKENFITVTYNYMDLNNPLHKKAYDNVSQAIHKKEVIEILDEGRFYYKFLPITHIVDRHEDTIVKLVELSDTDFYEDNNVFRFSLEELIEGRIKYLEREEEKIEAFNNKFPSLSILNNLSICKK